MIALGQYQVSASNAGELVAAIELGVSSGSLPAGQSLPSVRELATELDLSPATVSKALHELRRRGVVITEPRRGARIGDAPPIASRRPMLTLPAGAVDLSLGNPDPALLPDLTPQLTSLAGPSRLYGETDMLPQLADLAAGSLEGDGIDSRWLCVTSGALDAIERVLAARLRPGDRIAVENPGYAALFQLLRAQGFALEPVAIDEFGMVPDRLQRALESVQAVVLTPRGQNPTGAAHDRRRARELSEVLDRFPRTLVVEDDHLGEIAGTELHSTLADREYWAATRSVAKALGPDLRVAVLAGDRETIARAQGRQACGPGWVSHLLQRLVVALSTDEQVKRQIERARAVYTQRRSQLIAELAERGVHATGRSGLNVWVPVEDESAALAGLLARGWLAAAGRSYRLPGSAPAIRLTISTLNEEQSRRLADDLADLQQSTSTARAG